jgi:hypothetical protein
MIPRHADTILTEILKIHQQQGNLEGSRKQTISAPRGTCPPQQVPVLV